MTTRGFGRKQLEDNEGQLAEFDKKKVNVIRIANYL